MKDHSFLALTLTGLILLVAFHSTHAQTFHRESNETVEKFVKKNLRISKWAHPLIEKVEWGSKKIILAFISFKALSTKSSDEVENGIIGYVFFPTNPGNYTRAVIDTFHEEGAPPTITHIFFVNADTDKEREMAIMVKWRQHHKGVDGYLYDSFIYDNPTLKYSGNKLTCLTKFSGKFMDAEGSFDGSEKMAKYKTVQSIRAALKNMNSDRKNKTH